MSFCPKCKAEYINGRTDCADCQVPLVESLDDIPDDISVPEDTYVRDSLPDNTDDSADEEESRPERIHAFVSKKEKYKDYISTAYTFLIVGIAGIILSTLNLFHIVTFFRISGPSSILFYIVMYGMFGIFIFVGINAFTNSKRIKKEAGDEDNFLGSLDDFIKSTVNNDLFLDVDMNVSDEEIYFQRTEILKKLISGRYPDIDAALLEKTVDELYDNIF